MIINENTLRKIIRNTILEMFEMPTQNSPYDAKFMKKLASEVFKKGNKKISDYYNKRYRDIEIPVHKYEGDDDVSGFEINKIIMVQINNEWFRCFTTLSLSVYATFDSGDYNAPDDYEDREESHVIINKVIKEKTKEIIYDRKMGIGKEFNNLMIY